MKPPGCFRLPDDSDDQPEKDTHPENAKKTAEKIGGFVSGLRAPKGPFCMDVIR